MFATYTSHVSWTACQTDLNNARPPRQGPHHARASVATPMADEIANHIEYHVIDIERALRQDMSRTASCTTSISGAVSYSAAAIVVPTKQTKANAATA